MSLCARCGMNEPLPQDPDDFCAGCCADAEEILAEIEAREFACVGVCECGGNPDCERCNG